MTSPKELAKDFHRNAEQADSPERAKYYAGVAAHLDDLHRIQSATADVQKIRERVMDEDREQMFLDRLALLNLVTRQEWDLSSARTKMQSLKEERDTALEAGYEAANNCDAVTNECRRLKGEADRLRAEITHLCTKEGERFRPQPCGWFRFWSDCTDMSEPDRRPQDSCWFCRFKRSDHFANAGNMVTANPAP